MSTVAGEMLRLPQSWPRRLLQGSGVLWFLTAAIGQWIFVVYVAAYYIPLLVGQGLPGLGETHLPQGFVEGDGVGNVAIAFHVVIAVVIIGAGPLQLIPQIRNRFPAFHRFVGRAYLATAILTSIAGLYMVWTRGVVGGVAGHVAISLDGVLIIVFAAIALRHALAREFDRHRRWAMRLFMVVSAVWFFRIGFMFWLVTTGGVGVDMETFTGPFLTFWFFGQMLVPLAFLEIYFRAQRQGGMALTLFATGLVAAAALATGAGVFAATMGMWLPRF